MAMRLLQARSVSLLLDIGGINTAFGFLLLASKLLLCFGIRLGLHGYNAHRKVFYCIGAGNTLGGMVKFLLA